MTLIPKSGNDGSDWEGFPPEFLYLKEPAERYGRFVDLNGTVRRKPNRRGIEELRDVAQTIGWHNHKFAIKSWLSQNSIGRHDVRVVEGMLMLMSALGLDFSPSGPRSEPEWTLQQWDSAYVYLLPELLVYTRTVVGDAEALEIVLSRLERLPLGKFAELSFFLLNEFRSSRVLNWLEDHTPDVVAEDWGYIAAISDFSWRRAEEWLARGRPLSLVALDALRNITGESESPVVREAAPKLPDPEPLKWVEHVLREYESRDPTPRVKRAVATILDAWPAIVQKP
jgi:hypothetical protein